MTAKTMAEVLVAHTAWATTNPDGEWLITCVDCKDIIGTYDSIVPKEVDRNGGSYDLLDAALAAHQADALSAAGFGLVADAKAEALEEAAEAFEDLPANNGPEISSGTWEWFELFPIAHLRARAATLRGDS